jgi:hypothetical protein
VHAVGALLVGRALADDGLAADERRLRRVGARFRDGRLDRLRVVPVDVGNHVPAVGGEAHRRVVAEPALDLAVDGDAVVVVERDELAQPQRAGERAHLVGDALHQAAVAQEDVGLVVDDGVPGAVEFRGEELLGERHPYGVGEALAQRAGGGLDPRRHAHFRVPRRLRVHLAEGLQVVHRHRVAREVQQRVLQHRAVPVGEHEAVAVGPGRVGRVVAQEPAPQHFRDLGHAHGHAGVSGIGLLDGVHREGADGVGEVCGGGGGHGHALWGEGGLHEGSSHFIGCGVRGRPVSGRRPASCAPSGARSSA